MYFQVLDPNNLISYLERDMNEYIRRSEKNIHIRAISPDNAVSRERQSHDKEELRQMKLIPKNQYDFSPELNIYDDKVFNRFLAEKDGHHHPVAGNCGPSQEDV